MQNDKRDQKHESGSRISRVILLRNILLSILIIFLILLSGLYFLQDTLLFQIKKTTPQEHSDIKQQYSIAEEVSIKTSDNITLSGWFVKNTSAEKSPLVIYFGGNAALASSMLKYSDYFEDRSLLSVNYRGYGMSQGKPSEKNLFADSLLIYDQFSNRDDVDKENIVIMGYSLGSGVATYVAQNRSPRAVILAAPFDSITNVVQAKLSFMPVKPFVKHPFDSLSRASSISSPLLVLMGSEDTLIPNKHSMNLAKNWGGTCKIKIIENKGHNDMTRDQAYLNSIKEFLNDIR